VTQDEKSAGSLVTVLYDPAQRLLFGRHGKWVSLQEFAANPPEKPEDLMPSEGKRVSCGPDPGGSYKCIDHLLYYCVTDASGNETCRFTGRNC
jgi:hypothetical protein